MRVSMLRMIMLIVRPRLSPVGMMLVGKTFLRVGMHNHIRNFGDML